MANEQNHGGVTARVEGTGEPVEVRDVPRAAEPSNVVVSGGVPVAPQSTVQGTRMIPEMPRVVGVRTHEDKNPLGEQEITVRVRPGLESGFFHEGTLRKSGDPDFPMAVSQARAASMYLDEVLPDGTLRPVPHEQQVIEAGPVPRANVSGKARHERIEAYEQEEAALEERLARVREAKNHELEVAKAAQGEPAVPAAQPAPGTINTVGPAAPTPAFTPGTPGAPGTTAVPARPGEPVTTPGAAPGSTPAANSGPEARR